MHDLAATVNLSALDKVRIDFSVRLSYADGLQQVKDTLLKIAKSDPRILETPGLFVQLMELGDSQVEYVLRAYTNPIVAGLVRPSINEQIKTRMEQRTFPCHSPRFKSMEIQPAVGAGTSPARRWKGVILYAIFR